MTGVLIRRDTHRHTQRKGGPVRMETEVGVMWL